MYVYLCMYVYAYITILSVCICVAQDFPLFWIFFTSKRVSEKVRVRE
jgi:hypothetical protein